ncbi:MAG: acetylornithine deacetylase [Rhodospirillales bacterium]|jgi:acetylornithine deacetylase
MGKQPARPMTPVESIRRLIGFDTTSSKSNLALIDDIAGYLDSYGIASTRVHNDDGTKANIIAAIGPDKPGGVVLSGHTDVVPVTDQVWDTDPFELAEKNGKLYGRGTTDMKSFIAIALALVPEFLKRNLRVPIYFAFSYDEEVGCLGAPRLLDRLLKDLPKPLLAIIGEPTELKVVNKHREVRSYITHVTGKPAHSSMPALGVNAITHAAACIGFLRDLAAEMEQRNPIADPNPQNPAHTTINIGQITGGTATNIIAEHCRFHWDCRSLPEEDPEEAPEKLNAFVQNEILPAMKSGIGETDPAIAITTEQHHRVPPLMPQSGSPAEEIVLALTGQNQCFAAPFATEAGQFQESGIPAVVCGPGSAAQAHQPNEFIELAQVEACVEFLHKVADWAAGET